MWVVYLEAAGGGGTPGSRGEGEGVEKQREETPRSGPLLRSLLDATESCR